MNCYSKDDVSSFEQILYTPFDEVEEVMNEWMNESKQLKPWVYWHSLT